MKTKSNLYLIKIPDAKRLRTYNYLLIAFLIFISPALLNAQKWDQVSLSLTSSIGSNCHEPGRKYTFNYKITLPGGNGKERYIVESGSTSQVNISDVYGKSSIYTTYYKREHYIELGGSKHGSISVEYDDGWNLKRIKLRLIAVVTRQLYNTETKEWYNSGTRLFKEEPQFCILYLATPQVINLNGSPITSWDIEEPTDCNTYTLSSENVEGADRYEWILPHSSWAVNTTFGQSIEVQPNFNELGAKTITLKVYQNRTSKDGERSKTINVSITKNTINIDKSLVCHGQFITAIVTDIPAGSDINWEYSPYMTLESGQGTSSLKLKNNSHVAAEAYVKVTITSACGISVLDEKTFWLGRPKVTTNPSGIPAIQAEIGHALTINAFVDGGDISTLNWWITSPNNGISIMSEGSGNVVIECLKSGYHFVYVTATNECETSDVRQIPINIASGSSGGGDEDPGDGGGSDLPKMKSKKFDNNENELSFRQSVNVFPNPFNNSFSIELDHENDGKVKIELINPTNGQVITLHEKSLEKGNQKLSFDGTRLNRGLHIVRIISQSGNQIKRIVKK